MFSLNSQMQLATTVGSSGVTVVPVTQGSSVRSAAAASPSVTSLPQNALQIPSIQVVQPFLQHIPGLGQVC